MGNGNLTALLIAEKPDLMRQIETVYNLHSDEIPYGVAFMSQRGHLIALKEPGEMDEDLKTWSWETLPIVPEEHGGWQYKVIDEKKVGNYLTPKERYEMIRKELKSGRYDFVINAGDPDQEGQLLIWETLTKAGNTLPVKRFWTNDLTENAILTALKELRDDSEPALRNLLDAAYGRQHSDYRFGMNVSRAATLKMNTKVACGRCETWIQAVVVKREEEIRNFRPETVYGLKAVYEGGFEGTLFEASRMSRDKEETDEDKPEAGAELMEGVMEEIRSAAEDMDCDRLEDIFGEMDAYRIPEAQSELYGKLKEAAAMFDYEGILALLPKS